MEGLLPAVSVLEVPEADELTLRKAQAVMRRPHRNIRPVLKIEKTADKPPLFLVCMPQVERAQIQSNLPAALLLSLLVQLLEALLHLRQLKVLFLDLCEAHLLLTDKVLLDVFAKPRLQDEQWNEVRAPELIADHLVDSPKEHDYASADVWSVANMAVGLLWGAHTKLRHKLKDGALQPAEGLRLPPLAGLRNSDPIAEALASCLSHNPRRRLKLEELLEVFRAATSPSPTQYCSIEQLSADLQLLKSKQPEPRSEPALLTDKIEKFVGPVLEQLSKRRLAKFELVYQGTACQFRPDAFHQKCDKLSNLLVVCLAKNGRLFGGFSTESFDARLSNGVFGRARPSNSVLFSFSNWTVHRLKIKDQAVGCCPASGPVFGSADLVIGALNINNICLYPQAYKVDEGNLTRDSSALAGGASFVLQEYEVYQART